MGFLDKATAAAKQAATDAKKAAADFQANNPNLMSGNLGGGAGGGAAADRLLRDLGALTFLNVKGRPGPSAEYQRIMGELDALDSTGGLNLALTSAHGAAGAPPPPPGAVRSAYEAGQAAPPPPPPPASSVPPPPAPVSEPTPVVAPDPAPVQEPVQEGGQEGLGGARGTGAPPPPPSWS